MSSAGYIYTQLMEEASSAQHGPFYVTNVLEVSHEDLKVLVTSLSCSTGCSGLLCPRRQKFPFFLFIFSSFFLLLSPLI